MVIASGAIARSGLVAMLATHPDMEIVATASDVAEIAEIVARTQPDVILLDVGNLPSTGIWERLAPLQIDRSTPLLIIDEVDRLDLNMALRAGVRGILADTSSEEELIAAVSAVALGLVVFAPESIDLLMRSTLTLEERPERVDAEFSLTPREIEVLARLGSGLGNKAIAQALQISEHTVKFHLSSLFQKLDVSTRTEAVAMGIRLGLILL